MFAIVTPSLMTTGCGNIHKRGESMSFDLKKPSEACAPSLSLRWRTPNHTARIHRKLLVVVISRVRGCVLLLLISSFVVKRVLKKLLGKLCSITILPSTALITFISRLLYLVRASTKSILQLYIYIFKIDSSHPKVVKLFCNISRYSSCFTSFHNFGFIVLELEKAL